MAAAPAPDPDRRGGAAKAVGARGGAAVASGAPLPRPEPPDDAPEYPEEDRLPAIPDDALLAAWNAGRAKRRLPPIPLTDPLRDVFGVLRQAAGDDERVAAEVVAEYFRQDDAVVTTAGWNWRLFPHRIEGCLSEARRRVARAAPTPPPPKPVGPVATAEDRLAVLAARAEADPTGFSARLLRDAPESPEVRRRAEGRAFLRSQSPQTARAGANGGGS